MKTNTKAMKNMLAQMTLTELRQALSLRGYWMHLIPTPESDAQVAAIIEKMDADKQWVAHKTAEYERRLAAQQQVEETVEPLALIAEVTEALDELAAVAEPVAQVATEAKLRRPQLRSAETAITVFTDLNQLIEMEDRAIAASIQARSAAPAEPTPTLSQLIAEAERRGYKVRPLPSVATAPEPDPDPEPTLDQLIAEVSRRGYRARPLPGTIQRWHA